MEFNRKVRLQTRDTFPPKSDIADVVEFVKAQKVPGEIVVVLPGNGGVRAIEFRGAEITHEGEIISPLDTPLKKG